MPQARTNPDKRDGAIQTKIAGKGERMQKAVVSEKWFAITPGRMCPSRSDSNSHPVVMGERSGIFFQVLPVKVLRFKVFGFGRTPDPLAGALRKPAGMWTHAS